MLVWLISITADSLFLYRDQWTMLDNIWKALILFYVMKVIAKLGLCVSVYDIKSIEGGFIFPSDGAATYTVFLILFLFIYF